MALSGKYTSFKHIIEGVYRDYKFNYDIQWGDAVEWIGEGLLLIGEVPQYVYKTTDGNQSLGHESPIVIKNGRGKLPCDLYEVRMVRDYKSKQVLLRSFDEFHNSYRCEEEPICNNCQNYQTQNTYKINNNYIFTDFKEGELEMSYLGVATDSEGLPLIPAEQQYVEAMKHHIAEKIAIQLWMQDKLSRDKKDYIQQEKAWYFGSAKMQAAMPDLDQMESIKNQMVRLIPKINRHKEGFKYLNTQEQRYTHNSI